MTPFSSEYWIAILITSLISYLIGCINSSLVVTKILGIKQDIRTLGSKNAGFTNALRTLGKKAAILTFVGDFTKGVISVWISIKISYMVCIPDCSSLTFKIFGYTASLLCVIGHIYPCFFKFKGGKGILTAWASMLLIDWKVFLIVISIFIGLVIVSKIISFGSIFACIFLPISTFFTNLTSEKIELIISVIFTGIIGIIVIFKHKSNILRILNGTEKKLKIG